MTKEKINNHFEIKFWKDWLYANYLERIKLIKSLPFIKYPPNLKKLPKKSRQNFLATMLNSFFEDLEQAVYQKITLENKKNSKPTKTKQQP